MKIALKSIRQLPKIYDFGLRSFVNSGITRTRSSKFPRSMCRLTGPTSQISVVLFPVRFGRPTSEEYGPVYWSHFQRAEWSSRHGQRVLAELSVKKFDNFRVSQKGVQA